MTRLFLMTLCALALTGCASLDAAHIAGQRADQAKYEAFTDVQLEAQRGVTECFKRAATDVRLMACGMVAQAIGMANTFGGRPGATAIAPTTGQSLAGVARVVAPAWAAVEIARGVAAVQSKDPIVVEQPAPIIVRPDVVGPFRPPLPPLN
jgi:hypothetical protein